jgi:hypothetical protein
MVHFEDTANEDESIILKNKATEIRKVLFGALLSAKDIWKDELEGTREGFEIIETIEKAEEAFVNGSRTCRDENLENILNVIHARANGIFILLEYILKIKERT